MRRRTDLTGKAMLAIDNAVAVTGISKAFGATKALDQVSCRIAHGEVHALLGENGAGKSTLVKILSGLIQPDAGTMEVAGKPIRLRGPAQAQALGIQTAFQEITLIPDLSVAENMLLPRAPVGPLGLLRHRQGQRQVEQHLESLGLSKIDPRREVRDYELSIRQKIEIARAVMRGPRVLLLDEPTSSLSGRDIDWLGDLIATQKERGVTIIFISHRMLEVRRFCDRLTVLRNGRNIGTAKVDEVKDDEVVRMIIGRSLAATFPPKPPPAKHHGQTPVLAARALATQGRLQNASFELYAGEILGIAGLQGMGQQELFMACFGMATTTSGTLEIEGQPVILASPQDAMRANIGISLVPEERKTEGLFLRLSGHFNLSLPVIDRYIRWGLIDSRQEIQDVSQVLERVEVDQRALYMPTESFSGGNQQKMAIGKWLLTGSRILLLFDPTRGVDVGTKHQLYKLIRAFADAGGAVLFYSTEIPEIANLCDRVSVIYRGQTCLELQGEEITEERIMRAALGEVASLREPEMVS